MNLLITVYTKNDCQVMASSSGSMITKMYLEYYNCVIHLCIPLKTKCTTYVQNITEK